MAPVLPEKTWNGFLRNQDIFTAMYTEPETPIMVMALFMLSLLLLIFLSRVYSSATGDYTFSWNNRRSKCFFTRNDGDDDDAFIHKLFFLACLMRGKERYFLLLLLVVCAGGVSFLSTSNVIIVMLFF